MKKEHIAELTGLIERLLSEREATAHSAPPLLTAHDVAHRLQTNTQTIYRLAREGKLPAVKLSPRAYRWTEDIVSAFIAQQSEVEQKTLRLLRATG